MGDRASCVTVVQSKEGDGQTSTLCQLLIRLAPRRFLDLKHQFHQRSKGSQNDFNRIVAELHLEGAGPLPADPAGVSTGWVTRDLPTLRVVLPPRLKRASPYTFSDAAGKIKWSADSWLLGQSPENGVPTIPPDESSPMSVGHEESFVSSNATGTVTLRRTTDSETGQAGERIVRGEVTVRQRARVILRGHGPDSGGEKMDRDLRFMLQNLALKED